MVRRGVMFRRREASCCRVEVMKGAAGERDLSVRLTAFTRKGASFTAAITSSTSARLCSSFFFFSVP